MAQTLLSSAARPAERLGGRSHMGSFDLGLEPTWSSLASGDHIDVLAALAIYDETGCKHLFKSVIDGKFFTVSGCLSNVPMYTFLNCQVQVTKGRCHLESSTGYALGHQTPKATRYDDAIEVCAGIGLMGEGISSCHINIQAVNDKQNELCKFQIKHGQKNVIVGDIADPHVIAGIHSAHGSPALISGGFACQPWSLLGDQKKWADDRGNGLALILRASWWLRAHTILLECVDPVAKDENIQKVLHTFMKISGYHGDQAVLSLEDLFPARRTRWWSILTNPSIPKFAIRSLPKLSIPPVLGDMLPFCPDWNPEDIKQLALDRYETNKFAEFGGLFENIVSQTQAVRTALHGWANQLTGCPCLCRKYPFNENRLRSKGIFGALIPLDGTISTYMGTLPLTRHMHPWEMCWVHGGNPNRFWQPNLRLGIAGLGQMATPIQSCWVVAQWKSHLADLDGMRILPEIVLWDHIQRIFASVQVSHPNLMSHLKVQAFAQRVHQALHASAQANMGPDIFPIGGGEETENSQRQGLQNPQSLDEEQNKQPADQTQGLIENGKQPAFRTPEPDLPMDFQAKPVDPPEVVGPSPLEKCTTPMPCSLSSVMQTSALDSARALSCSLPDLHSVKPAVVTKSKPHQSAVQNVSHLFTQA